MRAGIALREDYDAAQLRSLAKATRNAGQSRRLLALAEIYDGGSRTKAAQVGGVGLQTIRDWVVRFNARGPGSWSHPCGVGPAISASASGASWLHSTAGSDGDCDASFGSSGRRAAGDTGNFAASRSPNGWPVRLSSARRDPGG